MEQRPSYHELTSTELLLNQSLEYTDQENAPSFSSSLESFQAAQKGLLTALNAGMNGEGESSAEVSAHVEILLAETARGFGAVVGGHDTDVQYNLAGTLMHGSVTQFQNLAASHDISLGLSLQEPAEIAESFEEELEGIDAEDAVEHLERIYGNLHHDIAQGILSHATQNQNDLLNLRRQSMKAQAIEALKSGAKLAVGAVATAAAIRLLSRK